LLSGHGARRPLTFDVTAQQTQHLTEWQVGVTDAGMGIPLPRGKNQVRVCVQGTTSKRLNEGRLAAAGITGDEYDLTLRGQRGVKAVLQSRELTLASNEGRVLTV
jgi:hypothetical protein